MTEITVNTPVGILVLTKDEALEMVDSLCDDLGLVYARDARFDHAEEVPYVVSETL